MMRSSSPRSSAISASRRYLFRAAVPTRRLLSTSNWPMSLSTARRVLQIEAQAIQDVLARLDASFEKAVDLLFACKGRVVVTGMGKSGLVARKISATFSSTGTPSFFLHPAEALHGDLGMLARGDAMIAVSYGGETEEIVQLLEALKRLEIPLVTLTGNIHSTLAEASDSALDVSVKEEACSLNLAPTASTTVAMAVGDALAVSLLERRDFRHDDFAALHPAGRLGKKLFRVEHLMHAGDALPRVCARHPDARRFPRNEQEGPGHDYRYSSGRPPCRNHYRRRPAPPDGKATRRDIGHDRGRLHDPQRANHRPARPGQRSPEFDGEAQNHFDRSSR